MLIAITHCHQCKDTTYTPKLQQIVMKQDIFSRIRHFPVA